MDWGTYPIFSLHDERFLDISSLLDKIFPEVGKNKPVIKFTKVVFPDPLSPNIPIASPSLSSKLIFLSISFLEEYVIILRARSIFYYRNKYRLGNLLGYGPPLGS